MENVEGAKFWTEIAGLMPMDRLSRPRLFLSDAKS